MFRGAVFFRSRCTMANSKQVSKESVEIARHHLTASNLLNVLVLRTQIMSQGDFENEIATEQCL